MQFSAERTWVISASCSTTCMARFSSRKRGVPIDDAADVAGGAAGLPVAHARALRSDLRWRAGGLEWRTQRWSVGVGRSVELLPVSAQGVKCGDANGVGGGNVYISSCMECVVRGGAM